MKTGTIDSMQMPTRQAWPDEVRNRARATLILNVVCLVLVAVAASGCAGREVLALRSSVVPDGLDLSGRWVLQEGSDDTIRRFRNAEVSAAGGDDSIFAPQRRPRRGDGSLVYVFLETGRNLKITQTRQGLFISFDRSIVEEYRFGEHREISVGPVKADRSSGFEGSAYVIETLDMEGNRLVDRYELIDDGAVLLRQITVYKRKVIELSLVQKFERA